LRLEDAGRTSDIFEFLCSVCLDTLNRELSAGAILRREEEVKNQSRQALWKGRTQLVRQAKALLEAKQYSEAAVAYEKYLRSLEVVFEKKPGELTPELFSSASNKPEITVIASVYWDLLNIYDTSNRYGDRQNNVARKLAEFARFTPIFATVARQAERRARDAKNPEAFRLFLKESNARRPRCFVATAAFDERPSPAVFRLRLFRETRLRPHPWGRVVISAYEFASPGIASSLHRYPRLKRIVRAALLVATRRWLGPKRPEADGAKGKGSRSTVHMD
jgi:hypothetical protein